MTATEPIPADFGLAFLEWLRRATEGAWDTITERTLADFQRARVGGTSWRRGTRWSGGLSEAEIDDAERRYDLRFPADYRLLLQVLHTTTPRLSGAAFVEDGSLRAIERPAFFDWRNDGDAIRDALAWPLEGILFDVERNSLWPPSWGRRPDTVHERRAHVQALLADAPKLVPVVGHRYLVPVEPHVVLSVYQSDIIVYGNDLRTFLLAELAPLLGLPGEVAWANASVADVPFWGELAA
jgi:hypothetical protein